MLKLNNMRGWTHLLTLATNTVVPSLPSCNPLIISGGIFGLLAIEGGRFITPGPPSCPRPPGNIPVRCSILRACSPSGSCKIQCRSESSTVRFVLNSAIGIFSTAQKYLIFCLAVKLLACKFLTAQDDIFLHYGFNC